MGLCLWQSIRVRGRRYPSEYMLPQQTISTGKKYAHWIRIGANVLNLFYFIEHTAGKGMKHRTKNCICNKIENIRRLGKHVDGMQGKTNII